MFEQAHTRSRAARFTVAPRISFAVIAALVPRSRLAAVGFLRGLELTVRVSNKAPTNDHVRVSTTRGAASL